MYNYFMLIGRLEVINKNSVVLKVFKPYKNEQGIFDSETFEVQLDDTLMSITTENFEIGDWFNIKGCIGKDKAHNTILIGERILIRKEREEKEYE